MHMLSVFCLMIGILGWVSLGGTPAVAASGGCAALIEAAKKGLRGSSRAVRECQMAQRSARDVVTARSRMRDAQYRRLRRSGAGKPIWRGIRVGMDERAQRRQAAQQILGEMLGVMGGAALRGRGGGHH